MKHEETNLLDIFLYSFFISTEQVFIYHTKFIIFKKKFFFLLSAEHLVIITDMVTKSYCLISPTSELIV